MTMFNKYLTALAAVTLLFPTCNDKPGRDDTEQDIFLTATAAGHEWAAGDEILVTMSGGGSALLTVSGVGDDGVAQLAGNIPERDALQGCAVFPAECCKVRKGEVTVTLSPEGGRGDVLAAVVAPDARTLSFRPLRGKLVVPMENIPSVAASVVLSFPGAAVAGAFTLGTTGEMAVLAPDSEGGHADRIRVRLDGSGEISVPLPPGTYTGWSVELEDGRGIPLRRYNGRFSCPPIVVRPGEASECEKTVFPKFNTGSVERIYALSDAVLQMYEDDSETILGPGITETDFHFTKSDGSQMRAFLIEADLSLAGIRMFVGAPFADNSLFGKKYQTLSEQAPMYETPECRPIVVVNADFWAVSGVYKDQLRGPVHSGGTVLKSSFLYEERLYQQALSYAGVRRDGTVSIGPRDAYAAEQKDLVECTGGGVIMLQDGQVPPLDAYPGVDPRTVMGCRGATVWFLVVDGRQPEWSNGLTYPEIGSILKAVGASAAVNLDGGGSVQLLVRNPSTGSYEIRNRPSDGKERAVPQTWIIAAESAPAQ